ncbi:MAG: type IV secretory system conjugative DNA transfer family protein [Ruminococcus sp.]|nr:type IV secretory system conjugative DNA transfer family protein [Ruminococcus sp.]
MKANVNPNLLKARKNGDYLDPDGSITENTGRHGRHNNNTLVVGSAGSGKTNGKCIEEILSGAGGGSMVISDAKGELYERCAPILEKNGYNTMLLDTINQKRGIHYNSILGLDTPNDVQKMSHILVYLGLDRSRIRDPFWPQAEEMQANCALGYFMEGGRGFEKSFYGLNRLLATFDADALANGKPCDAAKVFEAHRAEYKKRTGQESWAYEQFKKFAGLSERTFSTVQVSLYGDLMPFDTPEMREMTRYSDFDIKSLAEEKTALFINISDTDRSKDKFINIFYTQVMDTLCRYADSLPDKYLPVPVRFILDDFGSSAKIEGFENMISNIRSRGISVLLLLQSIAQLEQSYGIGAKTILANCNTKIYMGGSDLDTADYFSKLTNKPIEKIINMPMMTHWLVRQGEQPRFGKTLLLDSYELDNDYPNDREI